MRAQISPSQFADVTRSQGKRWSRLHEVLPQGDPDHHPPAEPGSSSPAGRHPGWPRAQPHRRTRSCILRLLPYQISEAFLEVKLIRQ